MRLAINFTRTTPQIPENSVFQILQKKAVQPRILLNSIPSWTNSRYKHRIKVFSHMPGLKTLASEAPFLGKVLNGALQ